jgi:ribosomal protein S14
MSKIETTKSEYKTVAQLREQAKEMGITIPRSARNRTSILYTIQLEQAKRDEAAKAKEIAKAKPAPAAKKRCVSCGTRPRTSESPEGQLCEPCLREAEYENEHSDYGHDINGPESDDATANNVRVNGCWICHPELNRASVAYVERAGTSRKGIVMTVSLRATGREKAEQVAAKLGGGKVSTSKGRTVLRHGDLVLVWDTNGRFTSEGSKFGKRTVRNASEALRLVGATQAA